MSVEYMYLNGSIREAELTLKNCKTGKIKTRKINRDDLGIRFRDTMFWDRVIVESDYEKELDASILMSCERFVKIRYKGKYELVKVREVACEERNYRMANVPLKECMRLMTTEQFINQFGEKVIKKEIAKEFMKWIQKQAENK